MAQPNLLRFPAVRRPEWSNDELSELYRVQNALHQAGIEVDIEKGQTDEGDPWFVFCRTDGEAVVQISRSEGMYILYASILAEPLVGPNFSELAKRLVELMPAPVRPSTGTLFLHPSSLLSILIASLFVTSDLMNSSSAFAGLSHEADFQAAADAIVYPNALPASASASALLATEASHSDARPTGAAMVATGSAERREAPHASHAAPLLSEALVIGAYIAAKMNASQVGSEIVTEASSRAPQQVQLADSSVASLAPSDARQVAELSLVNAAGNGLAVTALPVAAALPVTMVAAEPVRVNDGMPQFAAPTVALDPQTRVADASTFGLQDAHAMSAHRQVSVSAVELHRASAPHRATMDAAPAPQPGTVVVSAQDSGSVAIQLGGAASYRIIDSAPVENALTSFQLRITSTGEASNIVYISDDVLKHRESVDVVVSGSQDLEIHESVSVFLRSTINTSGFGANLSLGIVFGNNTSSIETLNIGTSNFDIRPGDSIALYELPDDTTIQVNSSVKTVSMVAAGATTTRDASLNLDLSSATSGKSLTFSEIRAHGADDFHISSLSKLDSATHTIETLKVTDLARLTLSGNTDLVINQFEVAASNMHNLTIDARQLASSLTLRLSEFEPGAGDARQINVLASQDGTTLTDPNSNHQVVFTGGQGADVLVVLGGEFNDTVRNFDAKDMIVLNGWSVLDNLKAVSGLGASLQSVIDSEESVTGAARAAAHLHAFQNAASDGPTAWLFTYRDATYVFADRNGDGSFDWSHDAVVQLVGYAPLSAQTADVSS